MGADRERLHQVQNGVAMERGEVRLEVMIGNVGGSRVMLKGEEEEGKYKIQMELFSTLAFLDGEKAPQNEEDGKAIEEAPKKETETVGVVLLSDVLHDIETHFLETNMMPNVVLKV